MVTPLLSDSVMRSWNSEEHQCACLIAVARFLYNTGTACVVKKSCNSDEAIREIKVGARHTKSNDDDISASRGKIVERLRRFRRLLAVMCTLVMLPL